jgi:hypothetical protein
MDDEDVRQPENSENWDWDKAQLKSGTKERRTIVSVPFPREDFKKVTECARELGISVSAFIRDAAVSSAEALSSVSRRPHSISTEPGTYAMPTEMSPIDWKLTGPGVTSLVPPQDTNARPLRTVELIRS